jgi:hypothetical protein
VIIRFIVQDCDEEVPPGFRQPQWIHKQNPLERLAPIHLGKTGLQISLTPRACIHYVNRP